MTKDEFARHLTNNGYPAENENGVVKISQDKPLSNLEIKDIHRLMKSAGYNSSYGYNCKRDTSDSGKDAYK